MGKPQLVRVSPCWLAEWGGTSLSSFCSNHLIQIKVACITLVEDQNYKGRKEKSLSKINKQAEFKQPKFSNKRKTSVKPSIIIKNDEKAKQTQ